MSCKYHKHTRKVVEMLIFLLYTNQSPDFFSSDSIRKKTTDCDVNWRALECFCRVKFKFIIYIIFSYLHDTQ